MIDIFKKSTELIKMLTKDSKEYWESEKISWDHNAIGPDNSLYDEEAMLKYIMESDRQRLLKYG